MFWQAIVAFVRFASNTLTTVITTQARGIEIVDHLFQLGLNLYSNFDQVGTALEVPGITTRSGFGLKIKAEKNIDKTVCIDY